MNRVKLQKIFIVCLSIVRLIVSLQIVISDKIIFIREAINKKKSINKDIGLKGGRGSI